MTLGGVPPEEPGFDTGNPAGFIRSLIQEGVGPTEGLALYRDPSVGGQIQDSHWFQLYGSVADTLGRTPEALGLDPYSLPGPADYGKWPTRTPDQYATQVEVQLWDRDLQDYITLQHTYITDYQHTPSEAEWDAEQNFDPDVTGTDKNQIYRGAVAIHLWRTVAIEGT